MEDGLATPAVAAATTPSGRKLVKAPLLRTYSSQGHENEAASFVIMHCPDYSVFVANLHPVGALFEVPVNLKEAQEAHRRLSEHLKSMGVEVKLVRDVLLHDTETSEKARAELEELAFKRLKYVWAGPETEQKSGFIGDDYKHKVIGAMDSESLYNLIMCNPTVTLTQAKKHAPVKASYTFQPLGNLVFTRDQQISTCRGIVMANMRPAVRRAEVEVMKLCFKKLGFPVIGQVPDPFTLEGGDFLPAGEHLCFIGVGPRTDQGAVDYMMKKDLFGTQRVAAVRDLFDRNQQRMHLDTIFNIASDTCVVLLETVIGKDSPRRRLVTEYTKTADGESYEVTRRDVEFAQYLTENGFNIIPISEEYQLDYAINFVNLGNGQLVSAYEPAKKLLEENSHFHGQVHYIPYRGVTSMYGGPHCSTQVFRKASIRQFRDQLLQEREKPKAKIPPFHPFPTPHLTAAQRSCTTDTILMIAPTDFHFNPETSGDNPFMSRPDMSQYDLNEKVLMEYSELHRQITAAGVLVHIFTHSPYHETPEAAFTDNWCTTHPAGEVSAESTMVLYPLRAKSRRKEKREDIIAHLRANYKREVNLSHFEEGEEPHFLEGSASLVFDRAHGDTFCSLSSRSHIEVIQEWEKALGRKVTTFTAVDSAGRPVVHTNMMLFIGSKLAIICDAAIPSEEDRQTVLNKLKSHNYHIISVTLQQMESYCCNVVELRGRRSSSASSSSSAEEAPTSEEKEQSVLVMSARAYNAFTEQQRKEISENVDQVVHVPLDILESTAGGSVRGLVQELF
ncbi:Arginine deiminase [Balamuthia mandrillaris]